MDNSHQPQSVKSPCAHLDSIKRLWWQSHTEGALVFLQTLFPLTLKSILYNKQLWTSYQGIFISVFPLPSPLSFNRCRFGSRFQVMTVSRSQMFLFFKMAFCESNTEDVNHRGPKDTQKTMQYIPLGNLINIWRYVLAVSAFCFAVGDGRYNYNCKKSAKTEQTAQALPFTAQAPL